MAVFVIRNLDNDLNRPLSDVERLLSLYSHPLLQQQKRELQQQYQQSRPVEKSDDFIVSLDVQHFSPEEVTVKVVDNFIEVEGKHEERPDEHGFVSRYFKRRYAFPQGFNADGIVSKLSSDGVLTIRAPKIQKDSQERVIPIIHTGPHRSNESQLQQKPEEKAKL